MDEIRPALAARPMLPVMPTLVKVLINVGIAKIRPLVNFSQNELRRLSGFCVVVSVFVL
jgi:hypothetical protein